MSGRIETFTSEAESSKWSRNKDISVIEAGVDIGDNSSGGGGSNVSVDQVVTSGREVAGVTVDGERTPILIPNAGEWTQSDWAEADPSDDAYIKNKPSLAQVATSGDYGDLSNTPDLSNFVEDANYVHTDHNYDLGAKNIVDHVTDNLAGKVDKVSGKVLSDNNFTNAQKDKLTNLADIYGVGANLTLDPETNILSANAQPITIDDEMSSSSTNAVQNRVITSALGDKVDKVQGKVLSDNNYSNADKTKLDGIDQGAEVNDISTISVNGTAVTPDQNKNVALTIPVNTSDLNNDSEFITNTVNNLTNYYLKTETYTQTEVNTLISAIITLHIEVVQTLPTTNISTTTIYLVPKTTAGTQDAYDEYINLDGTTAGWEHIGSTEVDLTNYYTKTETDTLLGNKVDKVQGKVLSDNNYSNADKTKLDGIDNGAEVNDISTISVNGVNVPADVNKNVDLLISSSEVIFGTTDPAANIGSDDDRYVKVSTTDFGKSFRIHTSSTSPSAAAISIDTIENGVVVSTDEVVYTNPSRTYSDFTVAYSGQWIVAITTDNVYGYETGDAISWQFYEEKDVTLVIDPPEVYAEYLKSSGIWVKLYDKDDIPTVNNGTLTIMQDGATLGSFTANQSSNSTIDIPAGGGGLLPHLIISAPTGSTVTATKGTTVITAVETSSGVFECDIPEYGDWTISDGTDSNITPVNVVGNLKVSIVNGATIVPTDDVTVWLKCGARYENYTTMTEILADTTCLAGLMSSRNAVDYLLRSTSFMTAISASENAMTYIGLNNYCANTLLDDLTNWRPTICNSQYFKSVLNVKVPVMTSNTTPSGECSGFGDNSYLIFDGDENTSCNVSNSGNNFEVHYYFPTKVKIHKTEFLPWLYNGACQLRTLVYYGKDTTDSTWNQIMMVDNVGTGTGRRSYIFPSPADYEQFRLYVTGWQSDSRRGFKEMQYYGRVDV